MHVLVIEDNIKLSTNIKIMIESDSHSVVQAANLDLADEAISLQDFEVIILDLSLPDGDGAVWCQDKRQDGLNTPILMLTARMGLSDKVGGLDSGADDYLTKPFLMEELLARIRALSRRNGSQKNQVFKSGDFVFNLSTTQASLNNIELALTPIETQILTHLILHRGSPQSASDIYDHVWGNHSDIAFSETLKVHITRLRKKIGANIITTIKSKGYLIR